MRHIIFLNHLESLKIEKDSTLMMALSLKDLGREVFLLFEDDFYFSNHFPVELKVFEFEGKFKKDSFYLESFNKTLEHKIKLNSNDRIHMRIDPPFDKRYLSYCWMLISYIPYGIRILNDPRGIAIFNEKLTAYQTPMAIPSYVGKSHSSFIDFIESLKRDGHEELILKPLEFFQGIGVEKVSIFQPDILDKFDRKIKEYHGPVVAQPFGKKIFEGEVRSIFYRGTELGSLLKIPPKGQFLANIAQGASYEYHKLSGEQTNKCNELCIELMKYGVDLVAFDILGEAIQEVNITCPGLLVEVSEVMGRNLALDMFNEEYLK